MNDASAPPTQILVRWRADGDHMGGQGRQQAGAAVWQQAGGSCRTCVSSSPAHMNLEIYPQIRCRSSLFALNEAAADSTPVYTLTSPLNSCGYLWLSVPWTHPAGCYHLLYWWRAPQKPPFITRKLVHYPEIRLWFPVCSHREMLRLSGDGWRVVAAELQPSTRPT